MEEFWKWVLSAGVVAWIVKMAVSIFAWNGNELIDRIKKLEVQREENASKIQALTFQTASNTGDIIYVKKLVEESNKSIGQVGGAIASFDSNMKIWHKEISTQNAEIKVIMDRSNELVQSTTQINKELLAYLKERGAK